MLFFDYIYILLSYRLNTNNTYTCKIIRNKKACKKEGFLTSKKNYLILSAFFKDTVRFIHPFLKSISINLKDMSDNLSGKTVILTDKMFLWILGFRGPLKSIPTIQLEQPVRPFCQSPSLVRHR